MNVLLINPSWGSLVGSDNRFNRPWPPLSLLNCAALLEKAGHQVRLIDLRATAWAGEAVKKIASQSDLILLTSSPLDRWQCPNLNLEPFLSLTERLPKQKLVICGVHSTVYPERLLTSTGASYVIRGEPESAVKEFSEKGRWEEVRGVSYSRNGKTSHNPPSSPVALEDLPLPAYHLLDPKHYYYELLGRRMALLETSRGCPFACPFCLKVIYGKGVRVKPVSQVIEELKSVLKKYEFRCVYFMDMEFSFDSKRTGELCQAIVEENLKFAWACQTRFDDLDEDLLARMSQAGCRLIHFGVETGKQTTQKEMRKEIDVERAQKIIKRAHKLGVATACFYMFGFAGETQEDRGETLALAISLNSTYASFHILSPYPTTPIFDAHCRSEDFFPEYLPETPVAELNRWTKHALSRFYLRPRHITQNLYHSLKQGNLLRKIRLFKEFL